MTDTEKPPIFLGQEEGDANEHTRRVALVVREILDGSINTVFELTLKPNATETTLTDRRASVFSVALLSPKTAAAAAAVGKVYYEAHKGEVTFHHDSQPAEDRTFGVVLLG